LRNAQWLSQPTKPGEDGYGDAGVSRDTGDWSDDLARQGYSVPEVPWRVLKLSQRPFKVGEWIEVIGVSCAPFDHSLELLFGFIGELRFGGCTLESGSEAAQEIASNGSI